MTKLNWNAVNERFYEAGTDRGVLYLDNQPGVPWNGLISVAEAPSGGSPLPFYIDGFKYLNVAAAEEFVATITAFTAPSEFSVCDGTVAIANGLFVTHQPRKPFAFCYRTRVGNDVEGLDKGYKLHIVYNALAEPSDRANVTVGDNVTPLALSWPVSTKPKIIPGVKPTAHLILDSTKMDQALLSLLEAYLYGAEGFTSMLPTPEQLIDIFDRWSPVDGLNIPIDFKGILEPTSNYVENKFTNPSMETVVSGSTIFRKNYSKNPIPLSTGTPNQYVGYNGGVVTYEDAHWYPRVKVVPLDTAPQSGTSIISSLAAEVAAPAPYTISLDLESEFGDIYVITGTGMLTGISGDFAFAEGEKRRISFTVISSSVAAASIYVTRKNAGTAGAFYVSRVLIEQTDQTRAYFDGDTVDALGFDYQWYSIAGVIDQSRALASVVEVDRNYLTVPFVSSSTAGWAFNSNITNSAFADGRQCVATATLPADSNLMYRSTVRDIVASVGQKWSAGVLVRNDGVNVLRVIQEINFYNALDVNVGSFRGSVVSIPAGATALVFVENASPPTNAAGLRVALRLDPAMPAQDGVKFTAINGWTVTATPTLPELFSGITAAKGDFIYGFAGAVNASASLKQGLAIKNVTAPATADAIRSLDWALEGAQSARIIAASGQNDTYAAIGGDTGALRLGMEAGKSYTAIAKIRLLVPQTGSIFAQARSIRLLTRVGTGGYVSTYSAQAPNEAGTHELRLTFTVPVGATEAAIRVMNGATYNNGDVWLDGFALIEVPSENDPYVGPVFDGDTEPFIYKTSEVFPRWLDVPHDSKSEFEYYTEFMTPGVQGEAWLANDLLWVYSEGAWRNYGPIPLLN